MDRSQFRRSRPIIQKRARRRAPCIFVTDDRADKRRNGAIKTPPSIRKLACREGGRAAANDLAR